MENRLLKDVLPITPDEWKKLIAEVVKAFHDHVASTGVDPLEKFYKDKLDA